LKILAVDDDEFILELLIEALGATDHSDVTVATGGKQALEIIAQATQPFECFLLDIQMPHMDGIELCGRIRKSEGHRKTPILMLTAMSERDYVDRAFLAGATDYITKPFDVLELGTRVSLAERLNTEAAHASETARTLDELTEQLAAQPLLDIAAPLDIQDVDGFLGFQAFENYIQQLKRGSYFSSSFIALKVSNIQQIFDKCDTVGFVNVLSDIADAISDNTRGESCLFSYAGSGVFVIVYSRLKELIHEDLQFMVQDTILQMGLVYPDLSPMEVEINQSLTKTAGIFSRPGSLGLLESAIREVVEMKPPGAIHSRKQTSGLDFNDLKLQNRKYLI
jgi:CheY-like chemotaxis protein